LLEVFTRPEFNRMGVPRVSDMHLRIGSVVRLRLDGDLVPLKDAAPLTEEMFHGLIYPLLNDAQIEQITKSPPDDIDTAYDIAEAGMSFRINVFADRNGPACVIRVLPRAIPTPAEIGFPDESVWRQIVEATSGLVLVTGVTGSGKSTTIASLLQFINRHRPVRIITLEDPIEYVLPDEMALISQRQMGLHVKSFADGLRSALREDPDIIFVGEMRDLETAGLALTAAETGHLVFSTLHTRDARGALSRIVDLFPPERAKELCTMLSLSLSWVIGQKLVNRSDGEGRVVAMEVLRNNASIANLIRTGAWHQIPALMETQRREGMMTMDRHLTELVHADVVSRSEAARHANDPDFIRRL